MDQLKAMRAFARVIDDGGFAAAARTLHVAPAVITRLIAELEEHLGARLITRTTRRLALTEVGDLYLQRARQILLDVDDAEAFAGQASTEPRGLVRVLLPPAFGVHQLAKRLPRFHAAYPQVALSITASGPVESLDENHDIAVLISRNELTGDFVARRLARTEVITCASPAYLDQRGRPSHPNDLVGHDALIPPDPSMQRGITFHRSGTAASGHATSATVSLSRRPALATTNLDLNLSAAIAGLGVAGLPSFAVEDALRGGQLERVLHGWRLFDLTIWACMPTRKLVPARVRAFMDFLIVEFGGDDNDPWVLAAQVK